MKLPGFRRWDYLSGHSWFLLSMSYTGIPEFSFIKNRHENGPKSYWLTHLVLQSWTWSLIRCSLLGTIDHLIHIMTSINKYILYSTRHKTENYATVYIVTWEYCTLCLYWIHMWMSLHVLTFVSLLNKINHFTWKFSHDLVFIQG